MGFYSIIEEFIYRNPEIERETDPRRVQMKMLLKGIENSSMALERKSTLAKENEETSGASGNIKKTKKEAPATSSLTK
jgi:hypothetical protein